MATHLRTPRATAVAAAPLVAILLLSASCRRAGTPAQEALQTGLGDLRAGKLERAEEHLQRAIALDGDSASAHCNLGIARLRRQRFTEAAEAFRKAGELSDDAVPMEYLGHAFLHARRWAEASEAFVAAHERDPTSSRILNSLAVAHFLVGDPTRAESLLTQAAEEDAPYAPALYNLAVLSDSHETKASLLRRYLAVAPDGGRAERARRYLGQPGDPADTTAIAQPHIVAPAQPPPPPAPARDTAAALAAWADGLEAHRGGDLDEAIKRYSRALELDDTLVNAWYNLGLVYKARKEFRLAEEALFTAVKHKPDMAQAHYMLAVVYRDLEETSRAVEEARRVIALDPAYAKAHFLLGLLYREMGKLEPGRIHLKRYLAIEPDGPSASAAKQLLGVDETRRRR
ncbi:MAG: tetratricopeptide repeat protein [Lentisphaerae bacterium]|nr:tetratricopeptide repeat protein [Lentisphaerota bacterium]